MRVWHTTGILAGEDGFYEPVVSCASPREPRDDGFVLIVDLPTLPRGHHVQQPVHLDSEGPSPSPSHLEETSNPLSTCEPEVTVTQPDFKFKLTWNLMTITMPLTQIRPDEALGFNLNLKFGLTCPLLPK